MNNSISDFSGTHFAGHASASCFDQQRAKIRPNKIFTTLPCQTDRINLEIVLAFLDYFPFSHLFFEPKTCASCLTRNVFLRMLYLYVFHGLHADVTQTWNFSLFPWYLCSGWFILEVILWLGFLQNYLF